jgi:hypothetical protein
MGLQAKRVEAPTSNDRVAFEEWAAKNIGPQALEYSDGSYWVAETSMLWKCWQAARGHVETPALLRGPTANDCWEAVNALIKPGQLQGNGFDDTATRNGLVMAANAIGALLHPSPEKTPADVLQVWECDSCKVFNTRNVGVCATCGAPRGGVTTPDARMEGPLPESSAEWSQGTRTRES